jgi:hypothetical protein
MIDLVLRTTSRKTLEHSRERTSASSRRSSAAASAAKLFLRADMHCWRRVGARDQTKRPVKVAHAASVDSRTILSTDPATIQRIRLGAYRQRRQDHGRSRHESWSGNLPDGEP